MSLPVGKPAHLPMALPGFSLRRGQAGAILRLTAENFPCDYLHPYFDQAKMWHNTKVFNSCHNKKIRIDGLGGRESRKSPGRVFFLENSGCKLQDTGDKA